MEDTPNLKQLTLTEWKQCGARPFGLIGRGKGNCIAVAASSAELTIFELVREYRKETVWNHFPYCYAYINVPQDLPCSDIISQIELSKIYANSSVQESQELAMEPMYVAQPSDTMKAIAILVDWIPETPAGLPALTLLTNCGALQLWTKARSESQHFSKLLNDVTSSFIKASDPPEIPPASITKFTELKTLIDRYWLTAFAWAKNGRQLHVGTAAGELATLDFSEDTAVPLGGLIRVSARLTTTLGRISYMITFDNFILVATIRGVVQVFSVDPTLRCVTSLWSHSDRITIQKACVCRLLDNTGYILVMIKAANLLAYRLDVAGEIIDSNRLMLGGVKLTGMDVIGPSELLVTTITGVVKRVRICCKAELSLKAEAINTNIDSKNMQILGVAVSRNGALISLLLQRNKEYTPNAKYLNQSILLSVCALSSIDPLALLHATRGPLNTYLDCLVALRLKIASEEPCGDICDLSSLELLCLDAALLQKFHVKLHMVRYISYIQTIFLGNIKRITSCELEFLQSAVQLMHLVNRRKRLQHAADHHRLQIAYEKLTEPLRTAASDDDHPQRTVNQQFVQLIAEEWAALPKLSNNDNVKPEECRCCNAPINWNKCKMGHPVLRCCVTYEQVPPWQSPHCSVCDTYIGTEHHPDESSYCTLCYFAYPAAGQVE